MRFVEILAPALYPRNVVGRTVFDLAEVEIVAQRVGSQAASIIVQRGSIVEAMTVASGVDLDCLGEIMRCP